MNLQAVSYRPESLTETIERYVRSRTGGSIRGLVVQVRDEEVVLSGRTSSYYNKQLATHAALEALEDVPLSNEIEVH
jgi:hypothetical protein